MHCLPVIHTDRHSDPAGKHDPAGTAAPNHKSNTKEKEMKKATLHTIAGLLAVGLAFGANFAHAQAGTLDPTFGNGGMVATSFANGSAAVGSFEQSNGDIVAVAQVDFVDNEGTGIGLVRYTSTGALDTTFGTDGVTNTIFAGFTFTPFGFAVQKNGNILVAGEAISSAGRIEFGLARYTSNGILDATFGNGGLVTTLVGTRVDVPTAMLLLPNGKIVMAGFEVAQEGVAPGEMSMVRYNSDGSLDTTFGTGGISLVTATITGPDALAMLSNGNYLAVGQNGSGKTGVVVELNSKGVLQSKVTAGTLAVALSSSQSGFSPTIFQPNGDYIVATTVCTDDSQCRGTKIGVSRFLETGKVDTTFNAVGFESFDPNQITSVGKAMALQANGQIVVGGLINLDSPILGGLARLDANGELDTTFGTTNSFGGCCTVTSEQTVTGLMIQTDGKIVAIGGIDGNLALQRYLATPGEVDPPSGLADVHARWGSPRTCAEPFLFL
jgi:uncharacterized delta-60 repeat protein